MKKYLNVTILLLALSIFSCTDLEEEPVGLLAPEGFFKTQKDVETAMNGAYARLSAFNYYGRQFSLILILMDDMCDIGNRGTRPERIQINDFVADANNALVRSAWPESYAIITAINVAEGGADILDAADEVKNALKAEAKFLRSLVYYHMVRLWGPSIYLEEFGKSPEELNALTKSSESEIYEHIIENLKFAKEHLPDQQPNNVRSRPTKGTAAGYLASVYLTLGDYQKAYDEAKWVIDNRTKFDYELTADFQDVFDATKKPKEHMFIIDFLYDVTGDFNTNLDYLGSVTGIRSADMNGWSVCVPSMAVYDTWDDADYRKTVSFDDSTRIDGVMVDYTQFRHPRPHIAKYVRLQGESRGQNEASDLNLVTMRYAEVLLTAAEALNEISGPDAEAIGYINQIRERARNWAGIPTNFPVDVTSGMSKDEFRDLVLDERRIELAFEMKRWYDIKRRDLGDEVFKGSNSLEPRPEFNSSKHYLLPIPQQQIDISPNLLPQNPGYN